MKRIKSKTAIICFITILSLLILLFVGLRIYTRNNHDIKVITSDGASFFLIDWHYERYYFVNTDLGTKCRTKEFSKTKESFSQDILKALKDLEEKDHMFSYDEHSGSVFVYENNIYYKKCKNYDDNNQIVEGALENIYKYDLITKEISVYGTGDPMATVLEHFYPDLEQEISKRCKNGFSCWGIYYNNGRIIFNICRSTSAKGTKCYLYEYSPNSNKTKKIAKFHSNVIDVIFE